MHTTIAVIHRVLEDCFAAQLSATVSWHEKKAEEPFCSEEYSLDCLSALILAQHRWNFLLWHVEDTARRRDVPDSVIADCKRRVDALNQKRNDAMEKVDHCLHHILVPLLPAQNSSRRNTETVGMAVDRLSILALKVYHMEEQTRRPDVGTEHVRACEDKLRILRRQREGLCQAVQELIEDYFFGNKMIVLYSQFKMYNDPSLNPEIYASSTV